MKSPFAILLAVVVLVGIIIGVAAIFLLSPTDQDDEDDSGCLTVANYQHQAPAPGPNDSRAESNERTSEAPETPTDESPGLDTDNESIETETVEPLNLSSARHPTQGGRGRIRWCRRRWTWRRKLPSNPRGDREQPRTRRVVPKGTIGQHHTRRAGTHERPDAGTLS